MLSLCRKIKESVCISLRLSKAVDSWMTNHCRPEHDLCLNRMRIKAMLAGKVGVFDDSHKLQKRLIPRSNMHTTEACIALRARHHSLFSSKSRLIFNHT